MKYEYDGEKKRLRMIPKSLLVLGVGFEPTKAVDRQIYSLLRLTTSLSQLFNMEPRIGLEPMTCRLQGDCSTN